MLYLIPSYLGDDSPHNIFPPELCEVVKSLQYFIVENEKSARKFIRFINPEVDQSSLHFEWIDKRFSSSDLPEVTRFLQDGKQVGLISEAGAPCIADPGSLVVEWAHRNKIKVKPLVGPSSIFLALMASGMNGQNFQFHGYLSIDRKEKAKEIRNLELESKKECKTQLFMETPYRNNALMELLLEVLSQDTLLCVASNITLSNESIRTMPVSEWKRQNIELHKKPSIFLILSQ